MGQDFRRYEAMRDAGADPQAVYQAAQHECLDGITLIRLLRAVFSLSLREAVDVRYAVEHAAAERLASRLVQNRGEQAGPPPGRLEYLTASDFQSMDQFPLRWRWTDPKWNELPPGRLSRILPLTASKARAFYERELALFHALNLRRDRFSRILEHDDTASVDPATARHWLRSLPVPEGQSVLVLWDRETAALVDWRTFCEYWDDFCYPMSDVIVSPSTDDWVLHYRSDERFVFGMLA
jgi:hypothetical protein